VEDDNCDINCRDSIKYIDLLAKVIGQASSEIVGFIGWYE